MQAPPPTGYLEIERALRLLALGESDLWIAGKLHGVDHPAATEAAMLLRQGRRRQAQAVLETTLLRLAGAADGRRARLVSRHFKVTLAGPGFHLRGCPVVTQAARSRRRPPIS